MQKESDFQGISENNTDLEINKKKKIQAPGLMSQQLATFLKQEAAKILAKVERCGVEDNGIYRVRFNRINLRLGFKITQ